MVQKPVPKSTFPIASVSVADHDNSKELWVTKYAPKQSKDLIGNQTSIQQLREWLRDWDQVRSGQIRKPMQHMREKTKPFNDPNAKCFLISGPPGIGKTSAVRLIAKEQEFETLELNASDARNKNKIEHLLQDLTKASSIREAFDHQIQGLSRDYKSPNKAPSKLLIIMDEVDGVGAGDRGGLAALIQIIKSTSCPIVCLCNDRQNRKITSLLNHCFDVKFTRPTLKQIQPRLRTICQNEKLDLHKTFTEQKLSDMIELSGSDIRQIINCLQLAGTGQQTTASNPNISSSSSSTLLIPKWQSCKDQSSMLSVFDAAKKLLSCNSPDFQNMNKPKVFQRLSWFFIDWQIMPLFMLMNYPDTSRSMNELASASEFLSTADCFSQTINKTQNYSMLPDVGLMSCVAPSYILSGKCHYTKFPELWGKQATVGKIKRMVRQLKQSVNCNFFANQRAVLLDYVPLLFNMVILDLVNCNGDKDLILKAVNTLINQNISIDMFKEHVLALLMDDSASVYESLDSKTKQAFTRIYNQVNQSSLKRVAQKGANKGQTNELAAWIDEFDPDFIDESTTKPQQIIQNQQDLDQDQTADGTGEATDQDEVKYEVVGKEIKETKPKASKKANEGKKKKTDDKETCKNVEKPKNTKTQKGRAKAQKQ